MRMSPFASALFPQHFAFGGIPASENTGAPTTRNTATGQALNPWDSPNDPAPAPIEAGRVGTTPGTPSNVMGTRDAAIDAAGNTQGGISQQQLIQNYQNNPAAFQANAPPPQATIQGISAQMNGTGMVGDLRDIQNSGLLPTQSAGAAQQAQASSAGQATLASSSNAQNQFNAQGYKDWTPTGAVGSTYGGQMTQGAMGQMGQQDAQQSQLANTLLAQSQGQGPSLAQGQLQAATEQNQKQIAGMMASQRGLNPGMAQKQVLEQQAAAGQQAAQQSAQIRNQEQFQAQSQYGNLLGQQQQQNLAQGQLGAGLYGTQAGIGLGQQQMQMQNTLQSQNVNAQVAQQNAAMQGQYGLQNAAAQNQMAQYNAANQQQSALANAQMGNQQSQYNAGLGLQGQQLQVGAAGQQLGSDTSRYNAQLGSDTQRYLGQLQQQTAAAGRQQQSDAGWLGALGSLTGGIFGGPIGTALGGVAGKALTKLLEGNSNSWGGSASSYADVSANPTQFVAKGGYVHGGKVNAPGDSLANDTVPAMLSPGEIILPRSVAQHPDAPEKAEAFVQAIKKRKGKKRKVA